jgi:hypothetical protein
MRVNRCERTVVIVGATLALVAVVGGCNGSPAGPAAPAGGHRVVINEVDYDQVGTDAGEFIEIYNPSDSTVSLAALALVLTDTVAEYARVRFGNISLAPGAYLMVADSAVTVAAGATVIRFATATNSVRNNKGGIALFDTTTNTLRDALSYGGTLTAVTITGAPGTYNLVEGTATSAQDSNTQVGSLARTPNGQDTNDASADWKFASQPTPGGPNP